jgi:hypothetical protein
MPLSLAGKSGRFGVQTDSTGQPYVFTYTMELFACASKLMIKAVIGRFEDAERELIPLYARNLERKRPARKAYSPKNHANAKPRRGSFVEA